MFNYTPQSRSEVHWQNIPLRHQMCLVVATGEIQAIRLHCARWQTGAEWLWGRVMTSSVYLFLLGSVSPLALKTKPVVPVGLSYPLVGWRAESQMSASFFAQNLGPPTPLHTVLKKQMHWRNERLKLRATATSPNLVQKVKRPLCRAFSYRWLVYSSNVVYWEVL